MDNLHDSFEKEPDIHDSFEAEPDLGPSKTESALRGAVQGGTLGFSDEMAGALGAAASPVQVLSSDDKLGKLKELYQQYRDLERQKNKAAEEANPKTYLAGNVAGGALGAMTGLGELGAVGTGAAMGLGASNADLTEGQVGRAAVDTAIGGGLGYLGGKVAEKVGGLLSPSALKGAASETVGTSIGAKGLSSERQKVGEAAIKAGVLKHGLTEQSVNAIKEGSEAAENELQPLLQQVRDKLSSKTPEEISQAIGLDAGDRVNQLIDKSLGSMKDMSSGVTEEFATKIAPNMQDYVLKLKEAGNDPVRLNEIKRAAFQEASDAFKAIKKARMNNQPVAPDFEKWANMARSIGGVVKDHIEQLANLVDPSLEQGITSANRTLGGMSEARNALTSVLSKGTGDVKISHPISYLTHPTTALAYDVARNLGKAGLAKAGTQMSLANKLEGTVGESLVNPAKQIGQRLTQSTPFLEGIQKLTGSPEASQPKEEQPEVKPDDLSRSLYTRSDEELKPIADAIETSKGFEHVGANLNKAIQNKDVQAKNSALFLLSSNPQLRKILRDRGLISQ